MQILKIARMNKSTIKTSTFADRYTTVFDPYIKYKYLTHLQLKISPLLFGLFSHLNIQLPVIIIKQNFKKKPK